MLSKVTVGLACSLSLLALGGGIGSGGRARGLGAQEFLRGDVNADGRDSVSDSLMIRRWLFNGDRAPPCHDAADADDSGRLDITDQVRILTNIFRGDRIPPPYPSAGTDPTSDDLDCASYEVEEPLQTQDRVRIGEVSAAPGSEVDIPVFVTNAVEVEAFQLVVKHDPDLFEPKLALTGDPSLSPVILDGSYYAGSIPEGGRFMAVSAGPDPGTFLVGFIPSFIGTGLELPPGSDTLAFKIRGTIPDTAPPGASVVIEPTNGPDGRGTGPLFLRNELTHRGEARYVSLLPALEGGILQIVPDQSFFLRGDSNSDGKVDLSDASFTLGFLFLGNATPRCLDAADADDDGKLDVTDPIATLMYLFLGGGSLPPPFTAAGDDPTPDTLGCSGVAS
ncbi:MAG: hypothetical protein HY721_28580 [Planctomycetes bacterium]|nr:hypothetical protein [Planctomycetota bacterium]